MSIQRFTANDRTTVNWAGGTSTELFIYPSNGSFAQRDFLFRISTATVEVEESTFTYFEGITRHLMILKGELQLTHEGQYTKHLPPYGQDTFSGEWATRSKGKVTDFNLMLKEGAMGAITHHHIAAGGSLNLTANTDYYFIYIASGTTLLVNDSKADARDLLQIDKAPNISISAHTACDIVVIGVSVTSGK